MPYDCVINRKTCKHSFAKEWARNTKVCMKCRLIRLVILHREVSEWGKQPSDVIDLFAKYFKPHKEAHVWWNYSYCPELFWKQMDEARLLSVLLMAEMCKTEDFSV